MLTAIDLAAQILIIYESRLPMGGRATLEERLAAMAYAVESLTLHGGSAKKFESKGEFVVPPTEENLSVVEYSGGNARVIGRAVKNPDGTITVLLPGGTGGGGGGQPL